VANLAALGSNPISTTGNVTGGNLNAAGQIVSTQTGNITTGGAQLYLNGTGNNRIEFNTSGLAVPNATTRSAGTKIVLYPGVDGTGVDYAIGLDTGVAWFSVHDSAAAFKWYANTTAVATLTGTGNLSATGNITGGNVLGGANVNATTHTGTTVSVSANITGGNLNAAGLSLSSNVVSALNVTSNIAGGNITTPGLISATGNITGGNVLGGANVNATTHTGTTVSVTGNITGGNLTISGNTATVTSANYQIGYLEIPQISLAANTTANLTVSGKHYYSTSASNLALTIANNTSVVWPVGTAISIVNRGTANITIAGDTGVSLYLAGNSTAGNRVVTTYGMATVMNVAANIWMINGTVV
jgi:hypothetical protein